MECPAFGAGKGPLDAFPKRLRREDLAVRDGAFAAGATAPAADALALKNIRLLRLEGRTPCDLTRSWFPTR